MISLKGKVVLVVDDEPGFREVLTDEFCMVGATVLEAENGKKAFEIATTQKVDAIVSDIRMAGGTGIELLDQIKETKPNLPVVILITGFSDLLPEDAYDKGAEAIFSKPCNLDQLVEAVYCSLLSNKERWVKENIQTPSDFPIELEIESLGKAISSHVINVGRGGMFVAFDHDFPAVNSRVSFSIKSPASNRKVFEGTGLCRWCRNTSLPGLPKGIGVEFQNFTNESFETLMEVLNRLKTKAFIPKGVI